MFEGKQEKNIHNIEQICQQLAIVAPCLEELKLHCHDICRRQEKHSENTGLIFQRFSDLFIKRCNVTLETYNVHTKIKRDIQDLEQKYLKKIVRVGIAFFIITLLVIRVMIWWYT